MLMNALNEEINIVVGPEKRKKGQVWPCSPIMLAVSNFIQASDRVRNLKNFWF